MNFVLCRGAVVKSESQEEYWICLACGKQYTEKPPGGRCRSLENMDRKFGRDNFLDGIPKREFF